MSVVCAAALSCSGPRVIPESRLSDIYADMFLADQWISNNYSARRVADTSLFYEPIFKKYGYTTADYDASVRYYIEKPDDYAKILKTAAMKLDNEAKRLQKVEDSYNKLDRISPYIPSHYDLETTMANDTLMQWHPADTLLLKVPVDSAQVAEPQIDTTLTIIDTLSDYEQNRNPEKVLRLHGPYDTTSRRYSPRRERTR